MLARCPALYEVDWAIRTFETAAPLAHSDLFVAINLTTRPLVSSPGCPVRSAGCSEFVPGPHQHGLQMRAIFIFIWIRIIVRPTLK